VDDSIVRGTTSRKIVRMMREAGATQVHMRISCPPTISPCYYGVDTPTREELLASDASCIRPRLPEGSRPELSGAARTLEEIRLFLDADSVGYLSIESLRRAVSDTTGSFCTSCYTGSYVRENVQLEVNAPSGSREQLQVTVPDIEEKPRE
jgi:amidophosphoribosyltransferase